MEIEHYNINSKEQTQPDMEHMLDVFKDNQLDDVIQKIHDKKVCNLDCPNKPHRHMFQNQGYRSDSLRSISVTVWKEKTQFTSSVMKGYADPFILSEENLADIKYLKWMIE